MQMADGRSSFFWYRLLINRRFWVIIIRWEVEGVNYSDWNGM